MPTIALAQLRSFPGDPRANLNHHLGFCEQAAAAGASAIFFPELSLTGYEPALAETLATPLENPFFQPLKDAAQTLNLIIAPGWPLRTESGIKIAMLLFFPDGTLRPYAKQRLHADEEPFFIPGNSQELINIGAKTLAPAICYESLQPEHAATAHKLGAGFYLASVAKSANGLAKARAHYPAVAKTFGMTVAMVNTIGPADNFTALGGTAVWNNTGELVAVLPPDEEGLLLVEV
jgi:predicted amidohydrolase